MAKYRQPHYHERYKPVHGHMAVEHPLYGIWASMIGRCENPDGPEYVLYGGRGIKVCRRWRLSFENFALDMGLPPTRGHSLDRRDNDAGYTPENCRWATHSEQMQNRRKFKNNTTGHTGVKARGDRFLACWNHEGERYHLGHFSTAKEAHDAREFFKALFATDRAAAMLMTERRARYDCATGIRGISKNDDGYIVRKTVDGVRQYMGFSKTLEGAITIWNGTK